MLQAVIRAVCTILDAFHFSVEPQASEDAAAPAPDAVETTDQQEVEDKSAKEPEAEAEAEDEAADEATAKEAPISADAGRDITNTLARRVLPVLQAALVSINDKALAFLRHFGERSI